MFDMMRSVFVAVALAFPVLLLLGALAMEYVERPLERSRVAHRVAQLLEAGADGDRDLQPDAVEALVAENYRAQVRRYWRRVRPPAARRPAAGPRPAQAAPGRRTQAAEVGGLPRGG